MLKSRSSTQMRPTKRPVRDRLSGLVELGFETIPGEPAPLLAAQDVGFGEELPRTGLPVLMVEQNARAALMNADRGYVLSEGRNRIEGKASDLVMDPEIGAVFLGKRPGGSEARP